MTDTQSLLATYAQTHSHDAFRELVDRYFDLVHSTAARRAGPVHAQDVAQLVFADLARLAPTLPPKVQLGGWLHRHTCFVAHKLLRAERRRRSRETEKVKMTAAQNPTPDPAFADVAPLLDDAIDRLPDPDRTAILLRFFERRDFRSLGQSLGTSEDAARMRVARAIDKLRALLTRPGINLPAVALTTYLSDHLLPPSPAGAAAVTAQHALAAHALTPWRFAKLAAPRLAATAAGVAVMALAVVAIISCTHADPHPPLAQPTPTTIPTAPTPFDVSLTGTRGLKFTGLIVADGKSIPTAGTLPATYHVHAKTARFVFQQADAQGSITLSLAENGNSLGNSSNDQSLGGVLATVDRGDSQITLFTTFDPKHLPRDLR